MNHPMNRTNSLSKPVSVLFAILAFGFSGCRGLAPEQKCEKHETATLMLHLVPKPKTANIALCNVLYDSKTPFPDFVPTEGTQCFGNFWLLPRHKMMVARPHGVALHADIVSINSNVITNFRPWSMMQIGPTNLFQFCKYYDNTKRLWGHSGLTAKWKMDADKFLIEISNKSAEDCYILLPISWGGIKLTIDGRLNDGVPYSQVLSLRQNAFNTDAMTFLSTNGHPSLQSFTLSFAHDLPSEDITKVMLVVSCTDAKSALKCITTDANPKFSSTEIEVEFARNDFDADCPIPFTCYSIAKTIDFDSSEK